MNLSRRFLLLVSFLCMLAPAARCVEALLTDDALVSISPALKKRNFGSATNLAVAPTLQSLLRFSFETLPEGVDATRIQKATLKLWVNTVVKPGDVEVNPIVAGANADWLELLVTGATLPPAGALTTQFTLERTTARQFVAIDVTPVVRAWIANPDSNFGLILKSATTAQANFDSKENGLTGHLPVLDVLYSDPDAVSSASTTPFGLSLLSQSNASATRATLQLGSAALRDASSLQATTPAYDSTANYSMGQRATGSDGSSYRAIANTTGSDPTIDDGTHWQLDQANANVTLNVPARFPTFSAAWSFLAAVKIPAGSAVTIQFADGAYSMNGPYVLNHPYGKQIRLVGNATTPANCVLNFTLSAHAPTTAYFQNDWGAFNVNSGNAIGLIDGFTMNQTPHNPYGVVGILAFDGGTVNCGPHLVIQDSYSGIAAVNGSTIDADGITVRGGGDGNIFAYQNSRISCQNCLSENANSYYAQSGLLAEFSSSIFAPNSTIRNNGLHAVTINTNSSVNIDGATLTYPNGTIAVSGNSIGGLEDIGAIYNGDTGNIGQVAFRGDHQFFFGTRIVSNYANLFGTFAFGTFDNNASLSVSSGGVATGFIGFPARTNVLNFASDGPEIDFRLSSNNSFVGTVVASLTANGFVQPQRSGFPPSPSPGQTYFDSGNAHFYGFNGTVWKQLDN